MTDYGHRYLDVLMIMKALAGSGHGAISMIYDLIRPFVVVVVLSEPSMIALGLLLFTVVDGFSCEIFTV